MMYDIQKASMGKRISAFLFDVIIFSVLAVGIAFIFSAVLGYNKTIDKMEEYYEKYSEEYGIVLDISESEYEALSEEDKAKFDEANEAILKDDEVQKNYSLMINLSIVIVTVSVLFATLIVEFAVPLFFGNGQTLGKKIFGVALVRTDSVKVTPIVLFIRAILGKFTIETMAPIMIIFMVFFSEAGIFGTLSLILLLGFNVGSMIATHNNSLIHDLLANTVAVDMATQMIFETPEEMMAYKKKIHSEAVERAKTTY
jgi:uncharacterized RDD family membrane protein YckC